MASDHCSHCDELVYFTVGHWTDRHIGVSPQGVYCSIDLCMMNKDVNMRRRDNDVALPEN